jgi:hypothetical protein
LTLRLFTDIPADVTYSPIAWVSAKTWQKDLIPWDMDASWLPVVKEFVQSGAYKPELRG